MVKGQVKTFYRGVKTVLAVIGAILLTLLSLAGGLFGYLFYVGKGLDQASKEYADQAIPAIVARWSPDELAKRESKAFRKAMGDQQLVQLFGIFRKLGAMKSFEGCTGESHISYSLNLTRVVTASYAGKASFDNGDAEIRVGLIQENGVWKIQGFHVNSPAFLK